MTLFIGFVIVVALLLVWAIAFYNRFVTLRNQVRTGGNRSTSSSNAGTT